jgi:hypothetical protein
MLISAEISNGSLNFEINMFLLLETAHKNAIPVFFINKKAIV